MKNISQKTIFLVSSRYQLVNLLSAQLITLHRILFRQLMPLLVKFWQLSSLEQIPLTLREPKSVIGYQHDLFNLLTIDHQSYRLQIQNSAPKTGGVNCHFNTSVQTMFPQIRSFVPFCTEGGYLFVYKVYRFRTPFTMIVTLISLALTAVQTQNKLLPLKPANCNTRRVGIETIYIFFGRYRKDLIRPLQVFLEAPPI